MKRLNTFDKKETLNTVGYTEVTLDNRTYLVNFNDRDSVEKFVKFLNNTRDNVYDIFQEKDGNLVVYRKDQYEIGTFINTYLHYIGKNNNPEQPINCRDMPFMFYYCKDITSLDLSNWDTSNVKDMSYMFNTCKNLKSLNLSNWNTSNVKDMSSMFWGCESLEPPSLSNWDTSNVEYMHAMFYDCKNLTLLNLSNWNTRKVIDMSYMFENTPIQGKYPDLSEEEIIKKLGGK